MKARGRNERFRPTFAVLFCAGLILAVAAFLFTRGEQTLSQWAGALGAFTAFLAFAVPQSERLIRRAARGDRGGEEHDAEHLSNVADELAAAVAEQWREEARARRLQDPWPLPVRWRLADPDLSDEASADAMGLPRASPEGSGGAAQSLADVFQMLQLKRLVILGEAGSGKSVSCILLALRLLGGRGRDDPVPVILSVSSWDPSRNSFRSWLGEYLAQNYQLGATGVAGSVRVARRLLDLGRLLPILDGLDEMSSPMLARCVTQLNRDLDPGQPIVVTCRTAEYRSAVEHSDVLTLSVAVELEPLDIDAITNYLSGTTPGKRRIQQWQAVFTHMRLEPDGDLATVLRNPLMISLARTIYADTPRNPGDLLAQAHAGRRMLEDHLLDQLVTASYSGQPPEERVPWNTDEVSQWLESLAQQMTFLGKSELTWWQLEQAAPRVVPHLVGDLCAALLLWLTFSPFVGGLFIAGVLTLRILGEGDIPTLEAWLRPRVRRRIATLMQRHPGGRLVVGIVGLAERVPLERRVAVSIGRIIALLSGFVAGGSIYHRGIEHAIARGVPVALGVGIAIGTFTVAPRTSPREATRPTLRGSATLLRHLAIGLVSGGCVALAAGLIFNSSLGLLVGVALGVSMGLVDGLNTWLDISTDMARALSPASTRDADRRAALARAAAAGLLVAITCGIAVGMASDRENAVLTGLAYGLAFALGDSYAGVTSTLWGRYLLAAGWLALAGRLPWRLGSFLEDAYRHGLLRRSGVAYQFRHARLQERLALPNGVAASGSP